MENKIKVTLIKSIIGCLDNHQANVAALGLNKIGASKIHEDNAQIRGMIKKVEHLVKVEKI